MGWKLPVLLAMSFASPAAAQGFERFRSDIGLRAYADSIVRANYEKNKEFISKQTGRVPSASYKVESGQQFHILHQATYKPEENTIYYYIGSRFDDFALQAHRKKGHSLELFTHEIELMGIHELVHSAMYDTINENNCEWWKSARFKDNFERDLWKLLVEGYADIITAKISGAPIENRDYEINDSLLVQPQGIHWDDNRLYAIGLAFFRDLPVQPQTLNALLSMPLSEKDYFRLPQLRERIRKRIKNNTPIKCEQK